MVDDISWDYDEVARASTILGYSSEATAAYVVGAPSSCGVHEGTLKDRSLGSPLLSRRSLRARERWAMAWMRLRRSIARPMMSLPPI